MSDELKLDYASPTRLRRREGHPIVGYLACICAGCGLMGACVLFAVCHLIYAAHPGQDADSIGSAGFGHVYTACFALLCCALLTGIMAFAALIQSTHKRVTGLVALVLAGLQVLAFMLIFPL